MASVNSSLIKHNLILGVDDRGKLSCHKVNLCFIYFDATDCIVSIQEIHSGAGYDINNYFPGFALPRHFSTKIIYSDPKLTFSFDFDIRGHP